MVINYLELKSYDKEGEVELVFRFSKEDKHESIKLVIFKPNSDKEFEKIYEAKLHWFSMFRFIKGCYASHFK